MDQNLAALVGLLNAAMEHVPPQTKAILSQLAQPNIDALAKKLPEAPAKVG